MLFHTLKSRTYKISKSIGQKYYSTSLDKNGEDTYEQYIRETVTKMNDAEFECLINDLKLCNKAYDFTKILTANMKRENMREVIIVLLQLGRESLAVPKIMRNVDFIKDNHKLDYGIITSKIENMTARELNRFITEFKQINADKSKEIESTLAILYTNAYALVHKQLNGLTNDNISCFFNIVDLQYRDYIIDYIHINENNLTLPALLLYS